MTINLKTNYTQNMTLSVTRQVSRNVTLEARYTGTLGRRLNGFLDVNQNNIYYNPELLQAFKDAGPALATANAAGYKENYTDKGINPCDVNNDPVLLDQMLAGLNLNCSCGQCNQSSVWSCGNNVVQPTTLCWRARQSFSRAHNNCGEAPALSREASRSTAQQMLSWGDFLNSPII